MATPVPPDEPAGERSRSCGFSIGPIRELIVAPDANSLMLSLARMMAPASRSFLTTKASSGGIESWSMKDPAVVGRSNVS